MKAIRDVTFVPSYLDFGTFVRSYTKIKGRLFAVFLILVDEIGVGFKGDRRLNESRWAVRTAEWLARRRGIPQKRQPSACFFNDVFRFAEQDAHFMRDVCLRQENVEHITSLSPSGDRSIFYASFLFSSLLYYFSSKMRRFEAALRCKANKKVL